MSLTTGEMSAADLAAVVGNNDGMLGGNGAWWIILLFLVLFNGNGWGNGYGAGGGNNGFVPYYLANNTDAGVQRGFDTAAISGQLSGIQASISNGFAAAEVANCNRAMADMERSFATQTAITGGLNNLSAQFANCCCENRLGLADLKYTVATENCADRAALSDGIREIIAANTASTQRILDQLCQDKIDAKNDTIAQLRSELLYARGQASQDVQTAQILAGQAAEVDGVYNRLSSCPVPSVPVYGTQAIFTNSGCGCGCNG